jgi:hypothetical protein
VIGEDKNKTDHQSPTTDHQFMPETFLTSTSHSNFTQTTALTPLQTEMDSLVSTFMEKAMDGYALTGIVFGTAANGGIRGGTLTAFRPIVNLFPKLLGSVSQVGSWAAGLSAEAILFEGLPRFERVALGNEPLSLLNLYGQAGLFHGMAYSGISLLGFRFAGVLTAHQNLVVSSLMQSGVILGAHEASALLGITERSKGSLGARWMEAQVTVLQIWTGMTLLHGFAPSLAQREQTKNLEIEMKKAGNIMDPLWKMDDTPLTMKERPAAPPGFAAMASVRVERETNNITTVAIKEASLDLSITPERKLPIQSEEKNKEFENRTYELETTAQQWIRKIDPKMPELLREKLRLGTLPSPTEAFDFIFSFLSKHHSLIHELLVEIQHPENRNHPDQALVVSLLKEMDLRISNMLSLAVKFKGPLPSIENLKPLFTSFYKVANGLLDLFRSNTYDPFHLNSCLEEYHSSLTYWHEVLFPDQSYPLSEAAEGSEAHRRLQLFFGSHIKPSDFTETYSDLDSLKFEVAEGALLFEGVKLSEEGEILGELQRTFRFDQGAWTVERTYHAYAEAESWETKEAKERLERELALYDHLGVERIIPADVPEDLTGLPFASLPWFRERLRLYTNHHHTVSDTSLAKIENVYEIPHIRDEKTGEPLGKRFFHDLGISWEGVLSLPPHLRSRQQFERYLLGRKATEQREKILQGIAELKGELSSTQPHFERIVEKIIRLYHNFAQQFALRHNLYPSLIDLLENSKKSFQSIQELESLRFWLSEPSSKPIPETLRKSLNNYLDSLETILNKQQF